MGDVTFNVVLAAAAFLAILRCVHRERQLAVDKQELRAAQQEVIGQIQAELAKIGTEIDHLRQIIPEHESSEAHRVTQRLVRTIDEIILITRGDDAG